MRPFFCKYAKTVFPVLGAAYTILLRQKILTVRAIQNLLCYKGAYFARSLEILWWYEVRVK